MAALGPADGGGYGLHDGRDAGWSGSSSAENSTALNPAIARHITPRTPPTFLLQNEDDHVDSVEDALSYYMGLKAAGVPVELHSYAQGGHDFGLRPTRLPVSDWPRLAETWLRTIGVLAG